MRLNAQRQRACAPPDGGDRVGVINDDFSVTFSPSCPSECFVAIVINDGENMKRREIFAGNWKMYTTLAEAKDLAEGILKDLGDIGEPRGGSVSSIGLRARCGCGLPGEDRSRYPEHVLREGRRFYGELSPLMVKDAGARYILIGHSERRHVFGETDEMVNRKVKAAFEFGLDPMICVGELLEEREAGKTGSGGRAPGAGSIPGH